MKSKQLRSILIVILSALLLFSTVMTALFLAERRKGMDVYDLLQSQYQPAETPSVSPIPSSNPTRTPLPHPSGEPSPSAGPEEDPFPVPSPTPVKDPLLAFLDINPDFVGWLDIPGTGIRFPVVQGSDNDHYLHHLFTGEPNRMGAIFLDFRNDLSDRDDQYLIYGHNMRDGTMFAELNRFVHENTREKYFANHSLVLFDTLYGKMRFEIFSAYVVRLNQETFQTRVNYTDAQFLEYLNSAVRRSVVKRNVSLSADSVILTLITCSPWFTNSRTLVHAVLLN